MKYLTLDKLKKFADALFARVEKDARIDADNIIDTWNETGSMITGNGMAGTRIHGKLADDVRIDGQQILNGGIPGSYIDWADESPLPGSQIDWNDTTVPGSRVKGDLYFATVLGTRINWDNATIPGSKLDFVPGSRIDAVPGSRISGYIPGSIIDYGYLGIPGSKINWTGTVIPGSLIDYRGGHSMPGTAIDWNGATVPGTLIDWTGVTIPESAIPKTAESTEGTGTE